MSRRLEKVEQAKTDRDVAEARLRAAIIEAVNPKGGSEGESQADVARAAGLTRGRIHQIMKEDREEKNR